jgi:DNA-binding SARP family transcriptional activator
VSRTANLTQSQQIPARRSWNRRKSRDLRAGNFAGALEAALIALRAEPLRESPHRLLLEIHLAEGNYSKAIYTYHAYRILLRRELGVNPSSGIGRLQDATVGPDSGPDGSPRRWLTG